VRPLLRSRRSATALGALLLAAITLLVITYGSHLALATVHFPTTQRNASTTPVNLPVVQRSLADASVLVQAVFRLEAGSRDLRSGGTLGAVMLDRAGRSVAVLTAATLIGLVLSTGALALASRRPRSRGRVRVALTILAASPPFLTLLTLICVEVALAQATHRTWLPLLGFGIDAHLVLPGITVAAGPGAAATLALLDRLQLLELEPFTIAARAKGLPERTIQLRHLLRNALVDAGGLALIALRQMLSSLILVEFLLGIGGLGSGIITALRANDAALLAASLVTFAALLMVIDSRVRAWALGTATRWAA
jgi:ABC-type dipeptide/oligopeptide/nickel transport system permease component